MPQGVFRMALGELYVGKPPVQFDEGRDWDRILTTAVCLNPLSQSRLLYFQFRWSGSFSASPRLCGSFSPFACRWVPSFTIARTPAPAIEIATGGPKEKEFRADSAVWEHLEHIPPADFRGHIQVVRERGDQAARAS